MALPIVVYRSASDKRVIGKTLAQTGSYATCQLLDGCSVTQPKVIVTLNAALFTSNYAYIAAFGRYYFINNITILDSQRVQLDMSVDVLETYKTQLKALSFTIKRQQYVYNLYLDDPLFQAQNKRQIVTKKIDGTAFSPSTLTGTTCFVLSVVGGI